LLGGEGAKDGKWTDDGGQFSEYLAGWRVVTLGNVILAFLDYICTDMGPWGRGSGRARKGPLQGRQLPGFIKSKCQDVGADRMCGGGHTAIFCLDGFRILHGRAVANEVLRGKIGGSRRGCEKKKGGSQVCDKLLVCMWFTNSW